MLNSKRLIEMARKSQKIAALGRRRNLLTRTNGSNSSDVCGSSIASRGYVFVYTMNGERFMIPMSYLNNIFRMLFQMSEDEFGLPSDGPITLPCDKVFMEYVVSLLEKRMPRDVERASLTSIATGRCWESSFVHQGDNQRQLFLYGC